MSRNNPTLYCQFQITSGGLCYGELHNMNHGSQVTIQIPSMKGPELSGTVIIHQLDYNYSAINGTWNVYQLSQTYTNQHGRENKHLCAWIACHETIDPKSELARILSISGSPYEENSGSNVNTDQTFEQGVLVINRYDWGYYDKRGIAPDDYDWDCQTGGDNGVAVGLLDHSHATEVIQNWKGIPWNLRGSSYGVWMPIPDGEYSFGRFGLNEDRSAVQSFLFFTAFTEFAKSEFENAQRDYVPEEVSAEERQKYRRMRFDGIKQLKRMYRKDFPAKDDCLGPYSQNEHVFKLNDIEVLRKHNSSIKEFAVEFVTDVENILVELVLSYVDNFAVQVVRQADSVEKFAQRMYPFNENKRKLDHHLFQKFMQDQPPIIEGLERQSICIRLRQFLQSRVEGRAILTENEDFVRRLCWVLEYLLLEVIELANGFARDMQRPKIVPGDIRVAIFFDSDLFEIFQRCCAYWYPANLNQN